MPRPGINSAVDPRGPRRRPLSPHPLQPRIGILFAIAMTTIFLRSDRAILDYPRAMLIYNWSLTFLFLMLGRFIINLVRKQLQDRGIGKDKVILVGTGDTGELPTNGRSN